MSETDGVACAWCQEEMSIEATACSHCGRLRRDIQDDKNRCYLFSVLMVLPVLLLFFVFVQQGQWTTPTSMVRGLPFITERFNFDVFISSPTGLLLIALFVIFLGFAGYYGVRVSKKLGQWIWILDQTLHNGLSIEVGLGVTGGFADTAGA